MLKVFEALHHAEAAMVIGLLEAVGIPAEMRGESLLTTIDGAPSIPGMRPSVWIHAEADFARARDVVERFSRGGTITLPGETPWTCTGCGEAHEPQFQACWQCGQERTSPTRPEPPGVPSR